jgi:hypothetical protein
VFINHIGSHYRYVVQGVFGETLGQGYRLTESEARDAGNEIRNAHANDLEFGNERRGHGQKGCPAGRGWRR